MRLTADLFRWGLSVLLMVPFLAIGGWALGLPALLWAALIAVFLGGAVNVAAVVRGIRRVSDGRAVDDILRSVDGQANAPAEPLDVRQRLIFPDEPDALDADPDDRRLARRTAALGSALGLVALGVAGALIAAVAIPRALAGDGLTLTQTYGVWGGGSVLFAVGLGIWSIAVLVVAAALWLSGRADGPVARRLASPRRIVALAAVAGAALVVGWFAPAAAPGLAGALGPGVALGDADAWRSGFGLLGVGLCLAAIVLTVPRWKRRVRR
ncbi:hypothetical protein [Microcella alkaliphila]|jgi:hypothetical protein|uniref:Cytochrome d oxidase subunit II n=1 Tax=Microcella alkaliphila TaxID=279828 RepID=A0A0U4WYL4_9MICO|nr:hypothetical protein [Microcella alkaliphila]BAU32810.1 cytochrome d oxidase subunit II [Microcella alkaliphila]